MKKKTVCNYAIARFLPYVETEEFANIGIVLVAPEQQYFDFKILTKKHGRITAFFNELEPKHYRTAVKDLRDELARVRKLAQMNAVSENSKELLGVFGEVVRTRESVVRFSPSRAVMTSDPNNTLTELFEFYVDRNFVTKEYREVTLERRVRSWLKEAKVADKYSKETLGDQEYQTTFPFVERQVSTNRPRKIIKPLALDQESSTKILDHGAQWRFRISELRRRGQLRETVLFAVEDGTHTGVRETAYRDAMQMLRDADALVLPMEEKREILQYALG